MSRVLFIDDEIDTLNTLKRGIELFGHQALTALNGQAGIALAMQEQPDIVFVDMQMAGLSGLEVVLALRSHARTCGTPVYVLSAGPELDAAPGAKDAGAAAYLLKPVRLQTLLDAIESVDSASAAGAG